jgi:acyl transferase domain-containing protein
MNNTKIIAQINDSDIAIIGMSGRFPRAKNIDEFWINLQQGVESISFFTDEELADSVKDKTLLNEPNFVKARGILDDVELFDASFFGFNPREAEITDPQHRLFLECAWEALENAGYDSQQYQGAIGVYGGSSLNSYFLNNVFPNLELLDSVDGHQMAISSDKDFLTTRISYKLNLEGPSYTVQTACSTSLVAVHLACQSLLNGECNIALAGGVAVDSPRKSGYLYQEGDVSSPDGHCRAFDAKAQGTGSGEGVGIVVLKRLEDAISDGDFIHAVIKGSAINNDGSFKVSYTAPRIDSQAKVIRMAQVVAEIEPETIKYIETHGTATALGDPIEIAALTQAFRASTNKEEFCAIGSVKTNIGHLDAAAGVAGLIKTILALKNQQIPPSLHFEQPNPQIDFASSPFYVNTKLQEWKTNSTPRRAGVSSFGIGGTNAHVILEEAPIREQGSKGAREQGSKFSLLVLSAKTPTALDTITTNLVEHIQQYPDLNLADVAYTLQIGRRAFEHRRIVVCQNREDALDALQDPKRILTSFQEPNNRPIAFMFTGLGTQYINMGWELYQTEPIFRQQVDICCDLLQPILELDLRNIIYPNRHQTTSSNSTNNENKSGLDLRQMLSRESKPADEATQLLNQTYLTQPAVFMIEYALAQLWIAWGIRPVAMIGYSIGEYVAACLAGVLSLEDALTLVAKRARMIQSLPPGAMLAVSLSEEQVRPYLDQNLSLSAINGSSMCVVAGTPEAVAQLAAELTSQGLVVRPIETSHAFHSQMMEAIAQPFTELVKTVKLNPPQTPYLSNVTGTWITTEQATNPSYWTEHLGQTVRFADGINQLWQKYQPIILEIGAGQTLGSLALQCLESVAVKDKIVLPSLRYAYDKQSDIRFLLNTLGQLWLSGVEIDWFRFYGNERRYRLPLPTYPFERQRFWLEPLQAEQITVTEKVSLERKPDIADWFYVPIWKQSVLPPASKIVKLGRKKYCWLVFIDTYGVGAEIAERLKQQGQDAITVKVADKFTKLSDCTYAINPQQKSDYDALLQTLQEQNWTPQAIAHFWSITPNDTLSDQEKIDEKKQHKFFEDCQHLGFYSLLFLTQALGRQDIRDSLKLIVVTSNIYDVTSEEKLCPHKATILGPCKVIPREYPNINCCTIDIVIPCSQNPPIQKILDYLITEFTIKPTNDIVAYRGNHRWIQTFEPVCLEQSTVDKTKLRERGIYLITGGLGGIGLVLAEHLAQNVQARLILVGRKSFPEKNNWKEWLATHDEKNKITRVIRKLQTLEAIGAEILVISADVANYQQMQTVISKSIEKFNQINGVIHTAGIPGSGVIQLKTKDIASNVLAPKVQGTMVLKQVFQNISLDFLVLCSSQSSILGELGEVDYCAANAFQDAYAHFHTCKYDQFTVSINWDAWQVGMAVETTVLDQIKLRREEKLTQGISSQEGTDCFDRVLRSRLPQIVVSTRDFQSLIRQNHSFESLEEELASASFSKSSHPNHPRPNLFNEYTAPRNEVEETIAQVWQQFLGIQQIGIYDNFFELGGDSLLATQIISRLRKEFEVELPLYIFFETPIIFDQALIVEQRLSSGERNYINTIKRVERNNAQQVLAKLNEISNQEVELMLNKILAEKEDSQ